MSLLLNQKNLHTIKIHLKIGFDLRTVVWDLVRRDKLLISIELQLLSQVYLNLLQLILFIKMLYFLMLKDYDRTSSLKQALNKFKKIKLRSLQLIKVNVSNFYLYIVYM